MRPIEPLIDDAWDHLFEEITKERDDLYELLIEYKEETTGKTIRRSWRDREAILSELEEDRRRHQNSTAASSPE